MQVLHLSYSDMDGGAARAAYRIHRGLREQGVDSKLLTLKKMSGDFSVVSPKTLGWTLASRFGAAIDSIPIRLFGGERKQISSSGLIGAPVQKFLRAEDPDIVNLHWICGGFMRLESIAKIKKPIVWRLADAWAFLGVDHYPGDEQKFRAGFQRNGLFDVDYWTWRRKMKVLSHLENLTIVCPSEWMARIAKQSQVLRNIPVKVIHTGHETNIFKPIDKTICRQILNLPTDRPIVLFGSISSTSDKRKGFEKLRRALHISSRQKLMDPETLLVIFGASEPKEAEDLGFETRYLGRFYDDTALSIAYNSADIFVCPTLEDNLPNTVLESMACGVPVVAFATGGIPEVLRHDEDGILVQNLNEEQLAYEMGRLMSQSELRRTLASSARERMVSSFSIQSQVFKYIELYNSLR